MSTDSADQQSAPMKRRPRARYRLVAFVLLGLAGSFLYYYAFCNWAWHSQTWTRSRIDAAIERGLDFLDQAGTFGKRVDDGGESPPHHHFLELVLRRHPHAGLQAQLDRAKVLNADNWQWRTFYGMPGWPRDELTALDRKRIQFAVNHCDKNYYAGWLLYGLYPAWTELPPKEHERLMVAPEKLRHSYHLTHALLAYVWMKHSDPEVPAAHDVDRLIEHVTERLVRAQTWDPFSSDIYNERVAFFLYMDDGPPIRRRWIERILLSQNADGGWTYHRSATRLLGQLVGYDAGAGTSSPHATFLALYALSEYQSRSESRDVHR